MALFLSTYTNKVDKKGRVSVPASYRAKLQKEDFNGIVVHPSFTKNCLEASGISRLEKLHEQIAQLDPYSEERDAFETAILGNAQELAFDGEGRVIFPRHMLEEAGISEQIVFVGKGDTFEIWEPEAYKEHSEKARKLALERRSQLRAEPRRNTGDEA